MQCEKYAQKQTKEEMMRKVCWLFCESILIMIMIMMKMGLFINSRISNRKIQEIFEEKKREENNDYDIDN